MSKNDFGAAHWSSNKVWGRRASNLRRLNKIQSEILLEFLDNHGADIQKSPFKVALQKIIVQLREADRVEAKD